ncbi:DUF309 domain-containing protein [Thalassobacillus hwangdonensis]|uniref:DUF309 domain-containing protein n=1 Tax=Thalassobacillus hwangdonensis TaxID=546108 RepID=A0ABW3L5M9_9BACI
MSFEYPLNYYQFFVSFNMGDYYECHDLLEEVWLEDRSNHFIKGLLQLSVAHYHYSYGNIKGARSMFESADTYLSKYSGKHWGISIIGVRDHIHDCLNIIPQTRPAGELPELPVLYLNIEEE